MGAFSLYLHAIVAGGDSLTESIIGLEELVKDLPWPVVLWLNEFNSPAELEGKTPFLDSKYFAQVTPRVFGLIKMGKVNPAQRYALDMLAKLHRLPHEIKDDGSIQASVRMAYSSWVRSAMVGLDKTFL